MGGIDMQKRISLLGVPMNLGQIYKGVALGPTAIRYAGVLERLEELHYHVTDYGDIEIKQVAPSIDEVCRLRNLDAISNISEVVASKVDTIVKSGEFPLTLGGDHSMAIGTIAGISKHFENLGVIWFDAHADLNTPETSPSGNIHGIPLAVNLGLGHEKLNTVHAYSPKIKQENIVLIGQRDLDPGEKELIKKLGIKTYTMQDIDQLGMRTVIEESIAYLKDKTDGIHLSLDLDALDPSETPGVGTPVEGGISFRESRLAMELLSESGLITSAEFVEVNPLLDQRNRTAIIAMQLITVLFGKKLL